nr:MAG TPA: hypothetical protein [Caudoviricetes sp.]
MTLARHRPSFFLPPKFYRHRRQSLAYHATSG